MISVFSLWVRKKTQPQTNDASFLEVLHTEITEVISQNNQKRDVPCSSRILKSRENVFSFASHMNVNSLVNQQAYFRALSAY